MAKWRRQPKQRVVIHSGQGSQFGRDDFNRWCKENNLITSMSRRGICYELAFSRHLRAAQRSHNGAMESFFNSLKKEIFDYIEVFYNRVRRHRYLNYLSLIQFEQQLTGH